MVLGSRPLALCPYLLVAQKDLRKGWRPREDHWGPDLGNAQGLVQSQTGRPNSFVWQVDSSVMSSLAGDPCSHLLTGTPNSPAPQFPLGEISQRHKSKVTDD